MISIFQKHIVAEVRAFNVSDSPHGKPSSWEAERIALCESWAEHIGRTFTDKTYGNDPWFTTHYINYDEYLEHQRNEISNHIPIGYYHDLIDGINTTEQAGDGYWGNINTGTINDNISGLTNQQLFSLFDNTVTSPAIFTTKLINSGYINGTNTTTGINNLFSSY